MAKEGELSAGEGLGGGAVSLVLVGREEDQEGHLPEPVTTDELGREPCSSSPWPDCPGELWPGECDEEAGPVPSRHNSGWPEGLDEPGVWEHFVERAAIAEYDGGLSRQKAEQLAFCEIPELRGLAT